ncbi:glutathione S-transferase family protein [Zavarzinia compransoris]|uniref:glutathione S-transferase family protein n=1 Tax=Zavarzinia marina TaxID=2911065 RepID=UPI001F43A199|nr:glutathione S-transferase family protein [Zavarzinia marina]MCF4167040.1 glutathione S-transferase family protein [Zavarzinia marina]
MTDLILHHYAMSPFSEKIRAMLGYAGMPWASAKTRPVPPRPLLADLAGGYRRVPIAQTGADVFCDTRVIAAEIAEASGRPRLAVEACGDEIAAYCRTVDSDVFIACMVMAGGWRLLVNGLSLVTPFDAGRLILDRVNIARTSNQPMPGPKAARARIEAHLADAETRLGEGGPYLFGEEASHADFAAYHSLWFMRDLGGSRLVRQFPKVTAWMNRIKALGDGERHDIDPARARAIAGSATPRPLPEGAAEDARAGKTVAIAPTDYARDATKGTLAGSTATRWIIRREHKSLGVLHVHFPKEGYSLMPG